MGTRSSARTLLAVAVLAAAVLATSSAWACFPFPIVTISPSGSGAPGSEVTLTGADFGDVVEVRWNSITGPELTKVPGPNFSVPVKIPDAPDGVYTMVVLSRAPDDAITVKAGAAFQVVSNPSTGGQASPAPTRPSSAPGGGSRASSDGPPVLVLALGGLAILALGGVGGARLGGRRLPSTTPANP